MPAEHTRPELKVRERIELGIATEDGLHWLRSSLLGHDQASGRLIVSWPTEQLRLFPFHGGQPLTVEVSRPDDALYTLDVLVESASTEPEPPQLVLRPTASWQRVQRRASVRQPVAIRPTRAIRRAPQPASTGTDVAFDAVLTDLSAGGMRVRSDTEVAPGDQLDLTFELPDGAAELRLRVTVLRVAAEGEVWEAGCQLLESHPAVREAIVQLVVAYAQRATRRRISSASETPKQAPDKTSPG